MTGHCKDCRHWMRDGMLAQRGTGGRVLRAVCSNYRSILYRGQMTPSSLGCLEFDPAALQTLLKHEATGYAAHTGAADARF